LLVLMAALTTGTHSVTRTAQPCACLLPSLLTPSMRARVHPLCALCPARRYLTPSRARVDGVGLSPDVACSSPRTGSQVFSGGRAGGDVGTSGDADLVNGLLSDPCVAAALRQLGGV
jgi:hypothetical protein